MPVSILPSRAELFILANAASPASFRGSREYTRDGRRRRDVADGEGDAPGEPGPGAVVERRREPVGARSTSAGDTRAVRVVETTLCGWADGFRAERCLHDAHGPCV